MMSLNQIGGQIKSQPLNDNFSYLDGKVDDIAGAGRTTETVKGNADALAEHLADKANPHGVTAAQAGAVSKSGDTMTGTLFFNKPLSSGNKQIDLQQGYAIYSDNVGVGGNNTRLWLEAPNLGEVQIGGRVGADYLNLLRIKSQNIQILTNGNPNQVLIDSNNVWHAGNAGPFFKGSGSPEGVVTAPVGAIYQRTDGGAGTTLYVKESGTGNTGWVAK